MNLNILNEAKQLFEDGIMSIQQGNFSLAEKNSTYNLGFRSNAFMKK